MKVPDPRSSSVVKVCRDLPCRVLGADELLTQLKREMRARGLDPATITDRQVCLGACAEGPLAHWRGQLWCRLEGKARAEFVARLVRAAQDGVPRSAQVP